MSYTNHCSHHPKWWIFRINIRLQFMLGHVQLGMFCEHSSLIWLGLSSALVFQVLTAAVGICSVDCTVTLISITVPMTTKLKLLTRFAKRTLWLLLTRFREYEEDCQFDFEHWERSALKKMDLSPTFFQKDLVFSPLVSYTFRAFLPSAWMFTYIFSFHSCLCVS